MIDYPLGTHYQVEHCVKNQLIWLRTLGEKAFGVTLPQVKIANNRYYRSSEGMSGLRKT